MIAFLLALSVTESQPALARASSKKPTLSRTQADEPALARIGPSRSKRVAAARRAAARKAVPQAAPQPAKATSPRIEQAAPAPPSAPPDPEQPALTRPSVVQPAAAKAEADLGNAPAPGSAPASSQPVIDAQSSIRLRAIEERVNDLKEKIFRSKARLLLLQEAVLHGTITGARAVLIHKNEMGGSFKLEQVQYALDGAPVYSKSELDKTGEESIDQKAEFEIWNGAIVPGSHQVSVYLVYRGNGFGVFSYLKNYTFKIKSSYTFNAEEGKQTTVKIVGYEKGSLVTELKDRPAVRYDVEVQKELRSRAPAPASK